MKWIKVFATIVITFLALNALTVNTAKAQVGVHVGLNFGTPYYRPAYGYYHPAYYGPAYYHPVPRYYYGPRYYAPAYYHPYFRGGYYRPYRRW